MKGLSLLKNTLAVGGYFSNEYNGDYAQKFAIGRTMNVPLSQRYTVQRNDMTYNPQAFDRPFTTITVDQTATVPLEWESIEKALDMERGEERVEEIYIKPAVAYIRQAIETDLAQYAYQNANMVAGALGHQPDHLRRDLAAALQALVEMGCPVDDEQPRAVRAAGGEPRGEEHGRDVPQPGDGHQQAVPDRLRRPLGQLRLVRLDVAGDAHGGHVGGRGDGQRRGPVGRRCS
jgi:hypothetical protein